MKLINDIHALLNTTPDLTKVLNLGHFADFPAFAGTLLASSCSTPALGEVVRNVYDSDPILVEMSCYDIAETARRNFEPGGPAATVLFARGVHAIMGHRVAHKLWDDGNTALSLATKSSFGRAFSTDIHPAAQIGPGLWLDHGLGFVAGETAVIAEDVSIWHNVTLGGTLNDSGSHRHPHVGRGAVIGAGAMLLGGITIGANANIAAGSIVVQDVPPGALAVGHKARIQGEAQISFSPKPEIS
ncbi:serine acetyltransferase [Parasedimentitalea marina]|uniref:serine O-acetyltransferase n=1 Tax=Parasedimentitalea marina TaxID=2483033 RepID=A0A3T0N313_9RHOB|nr:serine O-acetyltransferase [Parasedimentitalea marina]AZV78389.1 serine acetyltransferase [Parasedimentitalea marina]